MNLSGLAIGWGKFEGRVILFRIKHHWGRQLFLWQCLEHFQHLLASNQLNNSTARRLRRLYGTYMLLTFCVESKSMFPHLTYNWPWTFQFTHWETWFKLNQPSQCSIQNWVRVHRGLVWIRGPSGPCCQAVPEITSPNLPTNTPPKRTNKTRSSFGGKIGTVFQIIFQIDAISLSFAAACQIPYQKAFRYSKPTPSNHLPNGPIGA